MADFSFDAPAGVRVYVDPPQSDDHINRGDVEGTRTDRATYIFEKAGSYDLPPLMQSWWNLQSREARQLNAAGIHIDIAAVAVAVHARDRSSFWTTRTTTAVVLIGLGLLAVLAWLAMTWPAWRRSRAASEEAARQELRRRAAGGEAGETYRSLQVWLSRLPAAARAAVNEDAALCRVIAGLEASLFGDTTSWTAKDGANLARSVKAFSPSPSRRSHAKAYLPPLNAAPDPS
jgi:hypothetical protein